MVDRFNQEINDGDIIIFSTSGQMDEGTAILKGRRNATMCSVRNSSGYIKTKDCRHIINKTAMMATAPHLFL